jgi:hypothetical protein
VGSFTFKISFSCRIFRFSRLGVVSLLCARSWAIRLSVASVVARPRTGAHYGAHANAGSAEFLKLSVNVKHTLHYAMHTVIEGGGSVTYYDQLNFDFFMTYFCNFLAFFYIYIFASLAFVSLLISSFSLRSETSEKRIFFSLRSEINFA